MKKKNFYLLNLLVVLCFGFSFVACSNDDDGSGTINSTLVVNNEAIEITDLEAEYDDGTFSFWVNDVATTDKRVYIQAEFSAKENISAGTNITSKFEILFQRNKGTEYFMEDAYQSGIITIKEIDSSKKIFTIEFKEVKYISNLRNSIILNGILKLNYKVI